MKADDVQVTGVYWGDDHVEVEPFWNEQNQTHSSLLRRGRSSPLGKRLFQSDDPGLMKFSVPSSLNKHHYATGNPYYTHQQDERFHSQYTGFAEPQPDEGMEQSAGQPGIGQEDSASNPAANTAAPRATMDTDEAQTPPKSPPPGRGWIPSAFPNPLNNPVRCAIAYLPQYIDLQNGGDAQQQTTDNALRLCDPDWVLGGMYLEQVAVAMTNFSQQFGRQNSQPASDAAEGEDWKPAVQPWADLAIATARKMDIATILRGSSYYAYEDDDDMVNDAAQIFAQGLHDAWWPTTSTDQRDGETVYDQDGLMTAEHGILLFLSVQDRVCFISTRAAVASVLPWWRLDHIVSSMKPALRERDYGGAVLQAVANLSEMLEAGPPSMADRLHDFVARFGVVIIFAAFTFFFGAWGEYRDRRKRFQFAEERSQLKGVDKEKACLLQQGYKTQQCPICLESFSSDKAKIMPKDEDEESDLTTVALGATTAAEEECLQGEDCEPGSVDSYGIPLLGADGRRIKMLRCGHIFCESCWKSWIHSGCGNPCNCPVCRQDVGKAPRQESQRGMEQAEPLRSGGTDGEPASSAEANNGLRPPPQPIIGVARSRRRRLRNNFWETHPSYDSVSQSRLSQSADQDDVTTVRGGNGRSIGNDATADEQRPLLPRS